MSYKIKKAELSIKTSLVFIILASFFVMGMVIYLSPGSLVAFIKLLLDQPLLFILNYVPILLLMMFIYFLFGNSVFSIVISALIFVIGAYGNRTKINLRQDPVVPSDLTILTEVKSILENYDKIYLIIVTAAIIATLAICIISFLLIKRSKTLTWKKRLIGVLVSLTCFITMFFTSYTDKGLYDSFKVEGNIYFKVNQYISKGFLYSFLYDINNLKVSEPSDYNKAEFYGKDTLPDPSAFEDVSKPHIIMVMSEAFTDISNSELISFENYENPLEYYNSFIKRDDVLSGHIVVPNFGGGTSDTEFEVLTGCSTKYIESSQVAFNLIRKPIQAMPILLENIGYDTLAIHPGYGWFYNRLNVYNYMGFDDFIYLEEDFDPATQNKGGYISDKVTTESIINNFEKHIAENDSPLFEFCVTIQNHGPYEDKYINLNTNFDTEIPLSDNEKAIYSGYFEGIKDIDSQIEELVTYFQKINEPVVLVFFGDHLPGFSNGMTYFSQFRNDINLDGDLHQLAKSYETPYFIWANEAAAKSTGISKNMSAIKENENNIISSYHLGSMTAEIIGFNNLSMLFDYINDMRKIIPAANESFYITPSGEITDSCDSDTQELINKYRRWIYYKIFDEQ